MARVRGQPPPAFTAAAEGALREHDWPGNVRELRSVVQRAVLFTGERGQIDAGDLQLHPLSSAIAQPVPPSARTRGPPHERERILEALQRAHGNQKEAAKLLGYS